MAEQQTRFVVDLGNMKLKTGEQHAIAAAIQGAVLSHLAKNHAIPAQKITLLDKTGTLGMFIPDTPGGYKK